MQRQAESSEGRCGSHMAPDSDEAGQPLPAPELVTKFPESAAP